MIETRTKCVRVYRKDVFGETFPINYSAFRILMENLLFSAQWIV